MRLTSICLALTTTLTAAACATQDDPQDPDTTTDVAVGDEKADSMTSVTVSSGASATVQFTATGAALDILVDCAPPADPDTAGLQFTVTSSAIGQTTASPAYAGWFEWSGVVAAGPQKLVLKGKAGSRACKVRIRKVTGACTDAMAFRSPQTGHTHLQVGTTVSTWGSFPASGNHWGAWAKWNTVYTRPVKRGFYLHNLEHGGLVLSYRCSSPTANAKCAEEAANLEALKDAFGETRVIVTPDPQQPTDYAVRAWRTGYASSCFDQSRMLAFMGDHFRDGREDEDADPPIPYDPTTSTVPCQDLMAAPDSCN